MSKTKNHTSHNDNHKVCFNKHTIFLLSFIHLLFTLRIVYDCLPTLWVRLTKMELRSQRWASSLLSEGYLIVLLMWWINIGVFRLILSSSRTCASLRRTTRGLLSPHPSFLALYSLSPLSVHTLLPQKKSFVSILACRNTATAEKAE